MTNENLGEQWVRAGLSSTRHFHEALIEDGEDITWSQVVHGLRAFCDPLSISEYRKAATSIQEGLEESIEFEEKEQGAIATSRSAEIQTLEQLLEACKADLTLWKVDHYTAQRIEIARKHTIKDLQFYDGRITGVLKDTGDMYVQPMWFLKAWFVRREEEPFEAALDKLLERMQGNSPKYRGIKPLKPRGEYLFAPLLFDPHFNRRSADGTYTLAKASSDFKKAADAIIGRAMGLGLTIKRIMLPVGNDALNADNLQGTTTKGTWVDQAADQRDAIDSVCDCYIYLVERMAEIAPVDVLVIPSNHDRYSTYWLGKLLQAYFLNHPNVTVDTSKDPRKYYQFGTNMVGLDHGDENKPGNLALLMATEAPEMWAHTRYREMLRGHTHKKQELYQMVSEENGVIIRYVAALAPVDDWHVLHGFTGTKRAAEAMFYHSEHGPAGTFPVFVDELAA